MTTATATFEPNVRAPGEARHWVRDLLDEWSVGDQVIEDTVLLVSELITNVALHGRTAADVIVDLDDHRLHAVVHDDNSRLPTVSAVPADAASGRGLFIVDAIADDWGVSPVRDDGKGVWFELLV